MQVLCKFAEVVSCFFDYNLWELIGDSLNYLYGTVCNPYKTVFNLFG